MLYYEDDTGILYDFCLTSNEINIKTKESINAINKLKRENKKITNKAIGTLINENFWNECVRRD